MVVSILNLPVSWMAFGAQAVAGSVPVLYLAVEAGLIYYYFSRIASDRELHYFFAGMVTMGIVSGAFFVFESFYKLGLGQVTAYTLKAHAYTVAAGGPLPAGEVNYSGSTSLTDRLACSSDTQRLLSGWPLVSSPTCSSRLTHRRNELRLASLPRRCSLR